MSAGERVSSSGEGGGGTRLGVKGLRDPNADTTLHEDMVADRSWDPTFSAQQGPVTAMTAVVLDDPSAEHQAPLPEATMAPAPERSLKDETPVPTVDRLDRVKEGGQVDTHLGQKAEGLQRIHTAQSERMDELKQNAADLCKPGAAGAPEAVSSLAASGDQGPSIFGRTAGLIMPSPTGMVAAATATYLGGPGAGAAVAAVDTALSFARAIAPTTSSEAIALKGQGTLSDARTQTSVPQYGYKGNKPRDAFDYSAARPMEQLARPASSAPIAIGNDGPRSRLSAEDLWKPGALSDLHVRGLDGKGPAKDLEDQMASLRAEMDKTTLYGQQLKEFAATPLDLNRDNLTRAMASGTNIQDDALANRQVLQVRPPQLNFA